MVGTVQSRASLLTVCILGASLSSCQAGDPAFLPLPALCPQRSAAICSARSFHCADGETDPSCQDEELALCEALLDVYEEEALLTYDSVRASDIGYAEQAELDAGEPPFAFAAYFVGGLSVGAECERDSQCETGLCHNETSVCAHPPKRGLCEIE
jgi:hypothetical protein